MISETSGRPVLLGYRSTAGRFELTREDLRRGISILGHGADDIAALVAYACDEARLRALVLDLQGRVSGRLSGYIDSYNLQHFLYDALRIDEEEGTAASVHGQLAASAYACALDLSFEQEGIINAAMQILASERGVASPAAVADLMVEKSDRFRGRPADRLVARLASLSSLNMTGEVGALAQIFKHSAILNLSGAGQPEAVETAAALVIAKLLAMVEGTEAKGGYPEVVVIPQAGRLFRVRPIFRKTERLLASFVTSPIPKVLSSESTYGLDEHFEETGFIKIHSSAMWNGNPRRDEETILPNMFMVRNHPYGHDIAFIPREFEPRGGPPGGGVGGGGEEEAGGGVPAPSEGENPELVFQLLLDINSYETPTRQSVVAFLSQAYDQGLVERTLDKLQSEGCVSLVQRDLRSGRPMSVLTLTEKGKSMLEMSK